MAQKAQDPFLDRVRATIDEFDLLAPGEPVLVALSGGADSMALLHALHALGYAVEAAHLNHQLRGDASDADQAFVVEHCAALEVSCHCAEYNVAAHAAESGQSIEAAARDRRYSFLSELASAMGIDAIATGHHAGDQAETVLMRVLRGAGTAGLAGIPPFRQDDDVSIVRPLLRCSRAEITAWLESQNVEWREDESNTDGAFLRNRVRHDLLPQLTREYNPQLRAALCRTADNLRDDDALLEALGVEALADIIDEDNALNPEDFQAYPDAIQRRVLQRWLWDSGTDVDGSRLRAAVAFVCASRTGDYFDVGGGTKLYRGKDTVLIAEESAEDATVIPLAVPGTSTAFGQTYMIWLRDAKDFAAGKALDQYCNLARQVFDAGAAGAVLHLRTRRDGDRFTPFGMTGTRKLQDYFVDKGIPAPMRDDIPIVTSKDEIMWIVGYAIDARFAVTPETTHILEIEVSDAAE